MEARKITVISTKNNKKVVIMSEATTLSELKSDLRQNNIDYDGMTFYEGTSKTELKTDESILPHDVPYKGTTTNELVFMLTNTNKKIRSGAMSRAMAYAAIKANNLQAECVKKFGKNFTMCKTDDLISLIEEKTSTTVKEETVEDDSIKGETQAPETEIVDTKARAAISRLTEMLYNNDAIESYEKDEILDILGGKVEITSFNEDFKPASSSPYSDNEIDAMFDFVK